MLQKVELGISKQRRGGGRVPGHKSNQERTIGASLAKSETIIA